MVDIAVQVAHWRSGAREEWQIAGELLEKRHVRHALFFTHLALEKALKSHVCRHTADLAPRTHNLVRLLEVSGVALPGDSVDVLVELNEFAMAGRYPDVASLTPTLSECRSIHHRASEVFKWLMQE